MSWICTPGGQINARAPEYDPWEPQKLISTACRPLGGGSETLRKSSQQKGGFEKPPIMACMFLQCQDMVRTCYKS